MTKSFGASPVLRGIDLDVPARSLTAILGPSGCGKTTLLRLIAGFARPDGGTIAFDGVPVHEPGRSTPPQRRRVGYVPQEGALFPHLDVDANVTFGLPRHARRSRHRVEDLLTLVGLDRDVRKRFPHQLSGGQQQRVALARALAPRPPIVLLDEPFASLDAGLREDTGRAVTHALRAAGATGVLVTHDQGEALSLADQVAVVREGRLVQIDTPGAIYGSPIDTGVAEFLGEAVVLPALVRGDVADSALGTLTVASGSAQGPVSALIRPEQVEVRTDPASAGLLARVVDVSYFGHDAAVRLVLVPSGLPVVARIIGFDVPSPGTQVRLAVRGTVPVYEERVAETSGVVAAPVTTRHAARRVLPGGVPAPEPPTA